MSKSATRPKAPSLETVTTINEDGSRYFIHPADVEGFWTRWRRVVGWVLFAVFVALPWVPVGGYPAVQLDIPGRRFHLFGLTLMFQDLWLLFFLVTGLGFALFFVTAVAGRVWCGWTCPQTIFLDHFVRRIERFFEGDAAARRQLDAAPWSLNKLARRGGKLVVFFGFAAVVAFTGVAYFVSGPELWRIVTQEPLEHPKLLVIVLAVSGALFFDFAWFREQFCIVLCPYGRLQSALIDDNSVVVGYDERRGEPRGKAGTTTGDCIDCRRCVQVCPTGIDIRQGLQLECIACEACIDACDAVMEKLGRAKGLIRHDSLNGFAGRRRVFWRPRMFVYLFFAAAGCVVFLFAASQVKPVMLYVTRMQGAPFVRDEGVIRNQFLVRLGNKRSEEAVYEVRLEGPAAELRSAGVTEHAVRLGPGEEVQEPLILLMPDAEFGGNFDVKVRVLDEQGRVVQEKVAPFVGPFRSGKPGGQRGEGTR